MSLLHALLLLDLTCSRANVSIYLLVYEAKRDLNEVNLEGGVVERVSDERDGDVVFAL